MVAWTVWKYVKESGRCPFDDWVLSNVVTKSDKARLDGKIVTIDGIDKDMPPDFVKMYKGTPFHEVKVRADGKQLRPLCVVHPERRIIILCGAIEKDWKIPKGDLERAENLLVDLENGRGSIVRYF